MTSQHSQQDLFNTTSYQEDSPAKTSQLQGDRKASRRLQGLVSSTNSSESYAWFDQNTSSWRTYQRSLITDWTLFSQSFTRQGTMQNGQLFQRALLELPIKETDGGWLEKLPTPTTMDGKEGSMKHATKLLQGKTHRASGQPIQKTLSDKVMMEMILENPELMKIYQDHQMEERPLLPKQEEFVNYLREQITIKELSEKTTIKKTTIEHWFRRDKAGFSYPSIENWKEIKPHLKTIKFDKEMTTIQSKEWTTKIDREMLPTPTTMDHLGQRSPEALKKQMEGARKGRTSLSNLREAVNLETQEIFNSLLPTPRASDIEGGTIKDAKFKDGSFYRENKKGEKFGIKLRDAITLLPTPRAAHGMNMRLSENMAKLKHKKYLETEIAAEIHENLPTPSAREWKNGSADSTKNWKKQDQLGRKIHHLTEDTTQAGKCLSAMARQDKLSAQNGGDMFLNPAFVEEMMGYEVGWTDLKH